MSVQPGEHQGSGASTGGQRALEAAFLLFCVGTAFFHLYAAGIGAVSATIQRVVHLALMLVALFLVKGGLTRSRTRWAVDIVLSVAVIAISGYYLYVWNQRMDPSRFTGFVVATKVDIVLGILMIALILEATRRATGYTLVIVVLIFLAYSFFGSWLPGFLGHKGYSLNRIVSYLYLTSEGIYGIPIKISSSFIVLFVVFGAVLDKTGGGQTFIDLGYGLTGRFRGGGAKTAVVSSAFMGAISGSPVANVVTTGTFTIPLMMRSGFPAHVAGAVEAVASTGGLILPPVMGSAAFLMAELLGITYQKVAITAVLPAVLYYACAFFMADLMAVRYGVLGLPRSELPRPWDVIRRGWYTLLPLVLLVALLVMGRSPTNTAFWSVVAALVISQLSLRKRVPIVKLLRGLRSGVLGATSVVAACAAAGIVLAVVSITGLGPRFSTVVVSLSGNSLLVAAVLTMVVSLILGMGLPAVAVYLLTAVLCAPALMSLGASQLAAHMFVFYFGIISSITPPVALAAYAAAGISGASINQTGFTAFKMAIVSYFVPYFFLYSPLLLCQGAWYLVVLNMLLAVIGTFLLSVGVVGVLKRQGLNVWERILLLAGGLLIVYPKFWLAVPGFVLSAVPLLLYARRTRERPSGQT